MKVQKFGNNYNAYCISVLDYQTLGNIAYKIKAFAKALYYKDKNYEDNKNINIGNLIDLYYKLEEPENCFGLIKLIESNNKFVELKEDDKQYIWYINLHDYNKALNIINNEISNIKNKDELNNLKKYKYICLNGLYNWEQILSENESENSSELSEKDNPDEIKRSSINHNKIFYIEKEKNNDIKEIMKEKILLSKSCADLGKWDKLTKYINEINQIFLENDGKEYLKIKKQNEQKDEDVILNEQQKSDEILLKKEKNDNEETNYIPYIELVNNNEIFHFLKYDDSLFNLNIYSSIINIRNNNFELARKYIKDCERIVVKNIKVLMKESHIRGYYFLIKNQILTQLEQFIDYKQYHSEDIQYLEQKKKILFILIRKLINLQKYI